MSKKKLITFGIPCYNEELNVSLAYAALKKIADKNKNYLYEYVFVDNGSTDSTKNEILKLTKKNKNVIGVFLSRNFGPESSAQAIVDLSNGDAMVGFECDMQDPPELIPEFIKKWEEGFDLVIGVRIKTEENILWSSARKAYYRIFRKISNIDIPVDAGGFGLLSRKALDAIKQLHEKYRFYRGIRAWIGFKTAYVKYQRRERKLGKSSYKIQDYITYALRSFIGFSYLPLNLTIYFGVLLVVVSMVIVLFSLYNLILYGTAINSMVAEIFLITFFGGMQFLAISIIGKYIEVIIEETKNRPMYVIEEIVNKRNQK